MEQTVAPLILYSVYFGRPGSSRKVDPGTAAQAMGVDEKFLRVSKKLFISEEYLAIGRFDGQVKHFVRQFSVPFPLRVGIFALKVENVAVIDTKVEGEFRPARKALVKKFLDTYEGLIERAKTDLGQQFEPGDYPSLYAMEQSFDFKTAFLEFKTPEILSSVNAAVYQREAQRAESDWKLALEDMKTMLRLEAKSVVDHIIDRLTPNPDGSKKIFRKDSAERVSDFLKAFEAKNVGNDEELKKLLKQAEGLVLGVDAKDVREKDEIRANLATGMIGVKTALDSMLENAPARLFDWSE